MQTHGHGRCSVELEQTCVRVGPGVLTASPRAEPRVIDEESDSNVLFTDCQLDSGGRMPHAQILLEHETARPVSVLQLGRELVEECLATCYRDHVHACGRELSAELP